MTDWWTTLGSRRPKPELLVVCEREIRPVTRAPNEVVSELEEKAKEVAAAA